MNELRNIEIRHQNVRKKKSRLAGFFRMMNPENVISKETVIKHLPFIFFLFALGVGYIWNTHYTEKMIWEINKTSKELQQLDWEYMTTQAELMEMGKQSEISK